MTIEDLVISQPHYIPVVDTEPEDTGSFEEPDTGDFENEDTGEHQDGGLVNGDTGSVEGEQDGAAKTCSTTLRGGLSAAFLAALMLGFRRED